MSLTDSASVTRLLPASSAPIGIWRTRSLPHSSETVHQKQLERDRFCKAWGGGILKNYKIFKKSKNARNRPKSAQNQRNLKNFTFKFFFKTFKFFWFSALFRQFPAFFDFSKNLKNLNML
jgi:hypothetical protein